MTYWHFLIGILPQPQNSKGNVTLKKRGSGSKSNQLSRWAPILLFRPIHRWMKSFHRIQAGQRWLLRRLQRLLKQIMVKPVSSGWRFGLSRWLSSFCSPSVLRNAEENSVFGDAENVDTSETMRMISRINERGEYSSVRTPNTCSGQREHKKTKFVSNTCP